MIVNYDLLDTIKTQVNFCRHEFHLQDMSKNFEHLTLQNQCKHHHMNETRYSLVSYAQSI